jgi:NAD-dependent oxidoreductase involved in siderophore biosynthesis
MTPLTPDSIHHLRKDDIIYPPCAPIGFTDTDQPYYIVLNKVGTKDPGNFMLILQRVRVAEQDGKIKPLDSIAPHIYQLDDEHDAVKYANQLVAENWHKI